MIGGISKRDREAKNIKVKRYPPTEYNKDPAIGPTRYPKLANISATLIFYSIESGKSRGIYA